MAQFACIYLWSIQGIWNNIPTNTTSSEFSVYDHNEINVLSDHFFANQKENKDTFIEEWESFKFDLLLVRKKQVSLKEDLNK